MSFDLPRETVFPISEATIRLAPGPHPFIAGRERAIAANWAIEKAAKPALFDGEIAMLSSLLHRDGGLQGTCHLVRYSAFLLWRKLRPVPEAGHFYAHAIPVTSDGALLAVRMAGSTSNGGAVYFAAGSFEPVDFADGRADIGANMAREVAEETGLDLSEARAEPAMHALAKVTGTVLFRRYFLAMDAAEAVARVRAHIAHSAEEEIEAPVLIRGPDDRPAGLAGQMPALIDWHFRTPY